MPGHFSTGFNPVETHAPAAERLWRRVKKGAECWEWSGGVNGGGYGQIRVGGAGSKKEMVHRFVYRTEIGPIPRGLVVMHKCDNPRCVRPAHLRLGTPRENTQDMIAKGRDTISGERHSNAKLTEQDVRYIRANADRGPTALAREIGVSLMSVQHVIKRRTWKHVE